MADAVSLVSDFKAYESEFNLGLHEALALNSNIFNQATRNGIVLLTQSLPGNYIKKAYFSRNDSLVTRQDITSTAAVDSTKLSQVEEIAVKLHRKIGPTQLTFKAFDMAGLETPEGSIALGRQIGDQVNKKMASDALTALVAAVGAQTTLIKDITSDSVKTANFKALNQTRGLWGDQMGKLAVWVLHSTPYIDLVDAGLDITIDSVAGMMVPSGNIPGAMGAPFVVTDNTALVNSGSPDTYNTLGLAPMAAMLRQSGLQRIVAKVLTGQEQLIVEIQGEYDVTIGIDGYAWDTSNGGANPTDTNLGTTTNWDKVKTDTNALPIVKLLSQ